MLKKVLVIILFLLCTSILCSCSNASLPGQTGNKSETGESVASDYDTINQDQLDVVRYPLLGETNSSDYSHYYESGLLYPEQQEITDKELDGSSRKVVVNNKEYMASYSGSRVYSNDRSNFLKLGNYDEFVVDGKMDLQLFKESGFIKKLFIYEAEIANAVQIVSDFSEAGLKNTATLVLTDLYGSSISDYLETYYRFEYAKLVEYANDEQNRYVVCYRAYLNEVPTDDVLYVQFSLAGSMISVSAQRYLQYLYVDETSLTNVDDLTDTIKSTLDELDYSSFSLRETTVPCYYTMNSEGELYYVTEWSAFKMHTEDTGVTCVEVLAVKAQ